MLFTSGRRPRSRLRILVWTTLAFLLLNAVLLTIAALILRRPVLLATGGLLLLLGLGVIALRRRFANEWEQVGAAREDLRMEVQSMIESARRGRESHDS